MGECRFDVMGLICSLVDVLFTSDRSLFEICLVLQYDIIFLYFPLCSTGAGRTGVFIALSIVLERLQVEGVIDIHRTVKTLRLERPFLVQTVDQYRFCFQVAVDFLRNFEMTACYGALVT